MTEMLAGRGLPRSYFSNESYMFGYVVLTFERASSFEVYVVFFTPSRMFISSMIFCAWT